jgi:hypothetical protein
LGIDIDSALSWKNHITNLSGKLNKACYAIRAIKSFMSQESMKMTYYAYVHSLLSYGIIFWVMLLIVRIYLKFKKGQTFGRVVYTKQAETELCSLLASRRYLAWLILSSWRYRL